MKKKILVTAALPYANGPLHFGHIAGAYLPADCYSRYQRLKGSDLIYICGSDEFGAPIALTAKLAGVAPQAHVDHYHQVNSDFFKKLQISFDHYSRTTEPNHAKVTQQFFIDLLKNGYIEEAVTLQPYCEKEGMFLADRYLVGTCPRCGFDPARGDECPSCGNVYEAMELKNPRSKLTGDPLVFKETNHWFLHYERLKEPLLKWIARKTGWKDNVLNFARDYIENLKPKSITRDLNWGIPVPLPNAEGKVFHVWFDAPIGYISATQEWDKDRWREYWCDPKTKLVQFVGKDNIPFHAVFFPAMILGQSQPYILVDELPANEFYKLEGRQFSKSDNWSIDLDRFFTQFSADQIRYTIAANAPETKDSEFTWKDFQARCNSELLGKYGNLANRVLTFVGEQFSGLAPRTPIELSSAETLFFKDIAKIVQQIEDAYEGYSLRKASALIMELCHRGNSYFTEQEPWKLAKDPAKREILARVLYASLECLKVLAVISTPIIPESAQGLWKMLGFTGVLASGQWDELLEAKITTDQILPKPEVLFKRVEDEQVAIELELLKGLAGEKVEEQKTDPVKPEILFDDVIKIDLRIGKILSVERMEKSTKLLKLSVDVGFEKRTILAGIGEGITNFDHLLNKNVLVVINLKPRKMMGLESQGMLLACDTELGLFPLVCDSASPGNTVS